MLSLAHFDDFVLDWILSTNVASSQLISLYLCGNHALNTRLCRAVTTFRMVDEPGGRNMTKIPRLLLSLSNLRELAIIGQEWEEKVPETAAIMKSLPPTLKKLRIRHVWAMELFCAQFQYMRGNKDKPYICIRSKGANATLFWDLNAAFPELEELEIDPLGESANWRLLPQDLAVLPRTLKTLKCLKLQFTGMGDITTLPSLTSLSAVTSRMSVENLANLPRTLTRLGGEIQRLDIYISAFPRTLTSIESSLGELTPSNAAALPPSLTSLRIISVDHNNFNRMGLDWTSCLPSKLRSFFLSPVLDPQMIARYPRSLTHLEEIVPERFFATGSFVLSAPALNWPPNLTSIAFSSYTPLRPIDIASLPPTMTHLRCSLDRRVVNTHAEGEEGAIRPSPSLPNLTSLDLIPDNRSGKMPSIVIEFKDLIGCTLPRLRSLFICNQFELASFSALPPNLTELEITVNCTKATPFSDSHIAELPQGLARFRTSSIASSALRLLPRHLESAHFDTLRGEVCKEDFASLSQSLSSLEFGYQLPLTSSHYSALGALPASLRSLHIHNKLTLDLFKHISPRIVNLDLQLSIPPKQTTFESLDKTHARWLYWLTLHLSRQHSHIIGLCTSKLEKKRWSPKSPY